mmetsp:Transcript_54534/g.126969  ORF Transcript_54534/g.126969 Transcript_54534/m.126969 type:complete len:213 (+) Transcript_54534:301-939(+)
MQRNMEATFKQLVAQLKGCVVFAEPGHAEDPEINSHEVAHVHQHEFTHPPLAGLKVWHPFLEVVRHLAVAIKLPKANRSDATSPPSASHTAHKRTPQTCTKAPCTLGCRGRLKRLLPWVRNTICKAQVWRKAPTTQQGKALCWVCWVFTEAQAWCLRQVPALLFWSSSSTSAQCTLQWPLPLLRPQSQRAAVRSVPRQGRTPSLGAPQDCCN